MVKLTKVGKNQGDPKKMAPPPKEVEEDSEDGEMSDEEDESSGEEIIIPQKKRHEGYHNSRKEGDGFPNKKDCSCHTRQESSYHPWQKGSGYANPWQKGSSYTSQCFSHT
ncbi:hypothetical protein D623_10022564 [Myotis brandtii]|uniref:Uncharacterized protein n=1 Tax=Myotis brandtii TaxID=109478 RepID=S7MFN7_MYOBR|nr:hypothetical protein D623_10022564 [Myotis brandtii]